MYKSSKLPFLFLTFIFSLNIYAEIESVKSCQEQFQSITISEIQKIFSDESNYEKYNGQTGYFLFAQKSPNIDDMRVLFNLASEALGMKFRKLEWREYQGSLEQMRKEREQILDENGEPKVEYIGLAGYVKYAVAYHGEEIIAGGKVYHGGVMQKAYNFVNLALGLKEFKKLEWTRYQGSPKDFQRERERILDKYGNPKFEYIGLAGYIKYTMDYYGGNSVMAYENIKAVLEPDAFEELGWQRHLGSFRDLQRERERVLDDNGQPKSRYIGLAGSGRYAADYYRKKGLQRAYENVKAVLTPAEFKKLNWRLFLGSPEDLQRERNRILAGYYPKDEYLGMAGYVEYAAAYHDGNMGKAYQNVSAIIGGYRRMEALGLNWKRFDGTVSEYQNLLQLFKQADLKELEGCEGQKRVAKTIFKGRRKGKKAYRNVFSLAEILLGDETAFRGLNWSLNCY